MVGNGLAAPVEADLVAACNLHRRGGEAQAGKVGRHVFLHRPGLSRRKDDADGEDRALGKDPRVAPGVVAEIDERGRAVGAELRGGGLDLDFPGRAFGNARTQPGHLPHGGVGAIGADEVGGFGLEAFGEDTNGAIRLDCTDRCARPELRAGVERLVEQERIESFAHDHVGEGGAGIAHEPVPAPERDIEEAHRIFDDRVDREGQEALGAEGDAAAARLVPREGCPIEEKHARAAGREFAGGGAAGGTGADDDGIETGHRPRL